MDTHVLTVSSKGQISLPAQMRKQLSINTGDKLEMFFSADIIDEYQLLVENLK